MAAPALRLVSLGVALVVLLAGVALGADTTPATTALEAGPYARASAVLAVRVTQVTDVRAPGGALGRQVVRARVLRTFKGTVQTGEDVALIVVGQRPTLDPARPSVPYFRKGKHERYVVFLARARGRFAWQLQTLYDAEGRAGEERIAAVAAVAGWAGEHDLDRKARSTLAGLLQMLKSRGRWSRPHAARELAYLAQVRPRIFSRAVVGQLTRLAAVGGNADVRFWLRRAQQVLQVHARESAGAGEGRRADAEPWREAFEAAPGAEDRRLLLGRLLRGDGFDKHGWWAWVRLEPSSRVWLLEALVLAKRASAVPRLRALYGTAEATEVREGIVRAVGRLGGEGDVDWLAARLESPTARRAALIALARIRSEAALAHLRRARASAAPDEARWIGHLLSPAFPEGDQR